MAMEPVEWRISGVKETEQAKELQMWIWTQFLLLSVASGKLHTLLIF